MNINNTYFDGVYQHAWKRIIPPGLTEAEADLIMETCHLAPGNSVLDLMCGYGRHALELARRGLQVHAIDNLPAYIAEIDHSASTEGLRVKSTCADVLQAPLAGFYDAAVCMGNSFSFFNKEDGTTILRNITAHLQPGGRLLINSWMIAEIAIRYFKDREWYEAGEYKCMLDNHFLLHPSRIETEQTILSPGGGVEVLKGIDYIFTLDELEIMLQAAGLQLENLYSTPRKRPFAFGDSRIYIVAQKS